MNAVTRNVEKDPLSSQQRLFVQAYVKTHNGKQAAITAGYSEASAHVTASRLLKLKHVSAELAKLRNSIAPIDDDLQAQVLNELKLLGFSSMADYTRLEADGSRTIDFTNTTPEQLRAVNSIQTKRRKVYNSKGEVVGEEVVSKVTKEDKLRALDMIGRHIGMFKSEEHKVTIDVADRLLMARQRVQMLSSEGNDEGEESE